MTRIKKKNTLLVESRKLVTEGKSKIALEPTCKWPTWLELDLVSVA